MGVGLGVSVARNFIGEDLAKSVSGTVSSHSTVSSLTYGLKVRIADNDVRGGDVYMYIGPTVNPPSGQSSLDLSLEDYGDVHNWQQLNLELGVGETKAYLSGSAVSAAGALTATATSSESVTSVVVSAAVAATVGSVGGQRRAGRLGHRERHLDGDAGLHRR